MIHHKKKASSFEEVALPYLTFIYRSAYRLCGNPTDAEDLTQETFEIGFDKFSQLKDENRCKSWLFIILRNLFLKQVKKHNKYKLVDIDKLYYNDIQHISQDQIRSVMDGELQEALDKLDERYKTPLVLSYIGDFSYREIAKTLKIPMGTVMSRVARGKAYLKRELTKVNKINDK